MTRTRHLFRKLLLASVSTAFLLPAAQAGNDGPCGANAGSTLMLYGPDCLMNGKAIVSGIPNGDAVVPEGFTTAFLLSRTNGLILEQVGPEPFFEVNTADVWRIHTLVFDPQTFDPSDINFGVTTGYNLAAQFTQHGGSLCAAISFSVHGSKTEDCDEACTSLAAPTTMDSTLVCLAGGSATLTATVEGAHVVPEGFAVRYVLSSTNGLIVEQFSESPSFTVNSAGIWRIHSFVYDPAAFDPDTVTTGTTTIYDIFYALTQGGGPICGNILISGAFVKTGECPKDCTAEAGGLHAEQADLCLTDGVAMATAIPDGSAIVPDDFVTAYLFTQDGIVLAVGDDPVFMLGLPGQFRIHGFVYDPATFDLAGITAGTTQLSDIEDLIQQGNICAGLDLDGAIFQAADCGGTCDADAGAMLGGGQTACLNDGVATLTGVSYGDTVVPPGYIMGYLLSEDLEMVLLEWNSEPSFLVDHPGAFRIHAFVHDPATLDLSTMAWGEATVLDLYAELVQAGGPLCAGLDVLGADILVEDGGPACDAGEDAEITVCRTDEPFELISFLGGTPCPGGLWSTPFADVTDGLFDPWSSAVGTYTYTVTGSDGEEYMSTLTVNVVICTEDMVNQGLAPAADVAADQDPSVWPNPAKDMIHVALPADLGPLSGVILMDRTGRSTRPRVIGQHAGQLMLDVANLPAGTWVLRVTDGRSARSFRFVR